MPWGPRTLGHTSPDVPRLHLKPPAPPTGVVDGAWWPRLMVHGRTVRLEGYRTQARHTVDLVGGSGRVTLLVLPAQTDQEAAEARLAAAAKPGVIDTVSQLFRFAAPTSAAHIRTST